MTTNRLAKSESPAIIAPKDETARQRFWIERGNELLRQEGKDHLHWACINGHYFIEPRR